MLSLIVAYDKNKSIGNENTIPWRLKNDMLRVKELTTGQTIIMGRKTLESIGRPLPNRINRVLTRNVDSVKQYTKDYNNVEIYSDDGVFENTETEKVFIFGGGTIYNQYLNRCDEMFITEVDTVVAADTKFPDFSEEDWELIARQEFTKDENNEHNYVFMHYKRRKGD